MIRGLLAVVLAAAGCFSVPPYEPEDAVSYTAAGTGAVVAGRGFELRFATEGFQFPDSLKIDGTEVLGREQEPGCVDEDEVGLRISPALRISAHSPVMPVTNFLEPVLRGPAVVQAKLTWSTQFSMLCGADRNLGGTSTFTIFPNGRIVRHDELAYPGMSIASGECSCTGNNPGFTIATYWALARLPFRNLYEPTFDPPRADPLPPRNTTVASNADRSCVDSTDGKFQVALAWPQSEQSTILGGNAVIGFGRDLGLRGRPQLENISEQNSSVLFIERTDCLAALMQADAYVQPPTLTINMSAPSSSAKLSPRNGIYGDALGTGGPFELAGTERATLTGIVPTSFAVWLQFPRPVGDVRAKRQGAQGAWYMPQKVDERSWIVWFRDRLDPAAPIVIEPL